MMTSRSEPVSGFHPHRMFFGSFARGLGLCQLGVRLLLLESVLLAILQGRAHQAALGCPAAAAELLAGSAASAAAAEASSALPSSEAFSLEVGSSSAGTLENGLRRAPVRPVVRA